MSGPVPTPMELKLTIAKLLELSYRKDSGMTAQLIRQVGQVKLAVDANGNATLSGKAGHIAFSASEVTRQIGASVKAITVLMSVDEERLIRYNASFKIGWASVGVSGSIDVEKLITSCSGLLCQTARLLQGRSVELDRQLQEAMGY